MLEPNLRALASLRATRPEACHPPMNWQSITKPLKAEAAYLIGETPRLITY